MLKPDRSALRWSSLIRWYTRHFRWASKAPSPLRSAGVLQRGRQRRPYGRTVSLRPARDILFEGRGACRPWAPTPFDAYLLPHAVGAARGMRDSALAHSPREHHLPRVRVELDTILYGCGLNREPLHSCSPIRVARRRLKKRSCDRCEAADHPDTPSGPARICDKDREATERYSPKCTPVLPQVNRLIRPVA